jgi:hypothetical protein
MFDPIGMLWPTLPLVTAALIGAGLIALAIIRQVTARSPWSQTSRLLTWLRGFRLTIIGLALIGAALALLSGQTWLLVLSLGIAGEEIFETSWMISTLERDRRRYRS